ncbi:putative P-loop containing nucleoside triphosphate hydrolase, leucine-rich repeat domain, L [Medicago truncatula]|uniref:LRR and NB-ARC domain disease resistance protein n=1 Tax=Medicago truncatula TaxID=3880 RepID=A0A072UTH3_MEDTR|nr:disease resistance protein RPM1-like [Medicago truncatula]KEH32912.1 LRR and NB-ARC domain disease resistance protein [Medicago truncatula]RHN65519.1 putative P-loop containing nucleoside triphosphate hydrolase, leucine-rich repeat domain, L [Medicago truncatula]
MAETAVLFALGEVFKFLKEETNLLRGVHRDFSDIKDELEIILVFLKDADRRAADEADINDGIRTWVKQLREASFRIEDVIDEYLRLMHRANPPGCRSLCMTPRLIKTLIPRHKIASEIQDIKLTTHGIKKRSERYNFQISNEQGSSSSSNSSPGEAENGRWHDPRLSSLFIEETEIVGFEGPREEIYGWLLEGAAERTVISVVGMGGLGKTTLAKLVFESQKVTANFDCYACVTVSQSYTVRGLLINMMEQFCRGTEDPLPQMLHKKDDQSLIEEVRQYLQHKRYLIFFDDVWQEDFSDQIEFAMPNNNKGSRIIITTRMMHVAEFFKKSFLTHIHNLQLLPPNKAWELFCKKVFRFEPGGHCPPELKAVSKEIVQKCKQLPLAIVAIGGLLSTKSKTMIEWQNVSENMRLELGRNAHLTSLTKILSLSYDSLPYYLKPCILYFGIYPEDYSINHRRLTRQWIAEGFVKSDERRTLEQVAEEYLSELIHRSLIQVSNVGFEGKVKTCQVHDLLREVIIRKMKNLSFCHFVHEGDSVAVGITRRLSIASNSNNALQRTNNSHFRAIHVFGKGGLLEPFIGKLCSHSRILKVLDIQGTSLNHIPKNLGNLFHLRYLNLRNTKVKVLPKSIGELQNLETLDLRETHVHEMPGEINKLTKLRHLLAFHRNYDAKYSVLGFTTGVRMVKGIKNLTSLQKLCYVEVDHGGVDLIEEMEMLRQLWKLGLRHVKREHGNALSAAVEKMQHLESLNITAICEDEIIDLNFVSTPPKLRRLHLKARLQKLPNWVSKLEGLVEIKLALSKLKDDPMQSLKNLPNLLKLSVGHNTYEGEIFHFENEGFQKLKELVLRHVNRLNLILIEKGALISLEHIILEKIPQLKEIPSGCKHLDKLKVIDLSDMSDEFVNSIEPDKGHSYWIIKHVPRVFFRQWFGPKYYDYEIRTINSSSKES